MLMAITSKSAPPTWSAGSPAPASPCGRARTRSPTGSPARFARASRRAFGLAVGVLEGEVRQPQRHGRHRQAATSPCASGASLRARSTAGRQAESPATLRLSPPIPYTPANPITAPISTAPIARGIRRVAAGRGEGLVGHIVCHPVSDTAMQSLYHGRLSR